MTDALDAVLLDAPTRQLLDILTQGGHRAWVVGGAVRDALMDRLIGDIDVTTDARPERVAELNTADDIVVDCRSGVRSADAVEFL